MDACHPHKSASRIEFCSLRFVQWDLTWRINLINTANSESLAKSINHCYKMVTQWGFFILKNRTIPFDWLLEISTNYTLAQRDLNCCEEIWSEKKAVWWTKLNVKIILYITTKKFKAMGIIREFLTDCCQEVQRGGINRVDSEVFIQNLVSVLSAAGCSSPPPAQNRHARFW